MSVHDWVSVVLGIISLISAGVATYVVLTVRATMAEFKNDIKDWINGSFMRSKEVKALLDGIDKRLELLEKRVDALES